MATFTPRRPGRLVGIDGGLDNRTPDRDWHRDETCIEVVETAAPSEDEVADHRLRSVVVDDPWATAVQVVYAEAPEPHTAVFVDEMELI